MDKVQMRRLLPLFVGVIIGSIVMRILRGKTVTLQFIGFVTVFAIALSLILLLLLYFFGEKIRKHPKVPKLLMTVVFFLLAIGNMFTLINRYRAGQGIHWYSLVLTVLFFIGVILGLFKLKEN